MLKFLFFSTLGNVPAVFQFIISSVFSIGPKNGRSSELHLLGSNQAGWTHSNRTRNPLMKEEKDATEKAMLSSEGQRSEWGKPLTKVNRKSDGRRSQTIATWQPPWRPVFIMRQQGRPNEVAAASTYLFNALRPPYLRPPLRVRFAAEVADGSILPRMFSTCFAAPTESSCVLIREPSSQCIINRCVRLFFFLFISGA